LGGLRVGLALGTFRSADGSGLGRGRSRGGSYLSGLCGTCQRDRGRAPDGSLCPRSVLCAQPCCRERW
jgi:hypothetical protein